MEYPIRCPYCNDLSNLELEGYEEKERHIESCSSCDKNYVFSFRFSLDVEVKKFEDAEDGR